MRATVELMLIKTGSAMCVAKVEKKMLQQYNDPAQFITPNFFISIAHASVFYTIDGVSLKSMNSFRNDLKTGYFERKQITLLNIFQKNNNKSKLSCFVT